MNERDTKQLLQALKRVIEAARRSHGLFLTKMNQPWAGHTALTDEEAVDIPCETCGDINQAEYELATAYRFT